MDKTNPFAKSCWEPFPGGVVLAPKISYYKLAVRFSPIPLQEARDMKLPVEYEVERNPWANSYEVFWRLKGFYKHDCIVMGYSVDFDTAHGDVEDHPPVMEVGYMHNSLGEKFEIESSYDLIVLNMKAWLESKQFDPLSWQFPDPLWRPHLLKEGLIEQVDAPIVSASAYYDGKKMVTWIPTEIWR